MPVIKKHQTVFDFVAQHSGTMEQVFALAQSNGISITGEPAPGTLLTAEVADNKVTDYYTREALDIAAAEEEGSRKGGIGYMQIGNDFKVTPGP